MQRLVRLVLISAVMVGCAVKPVVDEPQEPMTASQELDGSPALSLLTSAEQARQQGDNSRAERYLERALNIAPASSWLYKQLADLRLTEGDARGAEGFALKALRLAPDLSFGAGRRACAGREVALAVAAAAVDARLSDGVAKIA